ncbi:helix-turn-helix transcriptional regulator [Rhodococcoides fascians]|uniref:helix-turn-helix transcriptional regulator n=1 Tax=Rhodococcoides fascians TaxID=1828 RepID=UPI0009B7E991|nr:helix-turn-helix domain-containing protein [Rhodococcus fascians]
MTYLTLEQAAEYAGISTRTLRRRISSGELPASRLGPRLVRVKQSDVDKLFTPIPAGNE